MSFCCNLKSTKNKDTFHSFDAAFHRTTDVAFIHALLAGNLPIALAEDQVSVHPAALNFRQGVAGVPQPIENLLSIQESPGAGVVQAGGVFDSVVTVLRMSLFGAWAF